MLSASTVTFARKLPDLPSPFVVEDPPLFSDFVESSSCVLTSWASFPIRACSHAPGQAVEANTRCSVRKPDPSSV